MLENWLGHWRNTTNKLVPKEFETFGSERFAFESDPRLQILEKLHPKTLLAMAHLLNQLVNTHNFKVQARQYALSGSILSQAELLVIYFWPLKNCIWCTLSYFECENENDPFTEVYDCFYILTGYDHEGAKFFIDLYHNLMAVISVTDAPY